jgi:hypothetical protein
VPQNVYRFTDASAPVLTGQVGSLIALLDACLVNGYGSMSAAGWTKPYSSTNAAVYLMGGSSNQRYYQVDDNGPGAAAAREARLYGFETMTAYNTGTNPISGGIMLIGNFIVIRKSVTADTAVRSWVIAADNRTVYGFVQTGDSAGNYLCFWFGDFYSFRTGDAWKAGLSARNAENSVSLSNDLACAIVGSGSFQSHGMIFRNAAAVAGAVVYSGMGDTALIGNIGATSAPQGVLSYPHSPDGGFYLAPFYLCEQTVVSVRGHHRGMWHGVHPSSVFTDGDLINGTGPYAGRTFLIVKSVAPSPVGYVVIETTAWPTSS